MRTGTKKELIVWLLSLPDDDQVYEITKKRQGRRLTQNAYYWQLVTQIADKIHLGKPETHNRMLRAYGRPWLTGGKAVTIYRPDTDETEREMLGSETLHWAPTSKTKGGNGGLFRRWVLLLPSHLMTVEEMSVLIDGAVQEAKQLDIETLTPRELEELRNYEIQKQTSKGDGHTS